MTPASPADGARPRYRPAPLLTGSALIHAAGAVTLAIAPGSWPFVAGAVVADHLVLLALSLWPQSQLMGPNLNRLGDDAIRRNEVGLSFDDGPDPEVTPRVLELLDRSSARATFFCVGQRAAAAPDLTAEIARRGHRVENHTWSHPNAFAFYPPAGLRREIGRAQETLGTITGSAPRLFRAPAGFRSPLLERELWRAGLTLTSWTRRGYDTVRRDPAAVLHRLTRGVEAGDVLLLHDGSAIGGGGNPIVLDVLPRLLEHLKGRGLSPVPLEPR